MNYYKEKIKLVIVGSENNTFIDKTPWAEYEFLEYTMYDPRKTYKKDTTFIVNDFSLEHDEKHIVKFLLDAGYNVIVDAVWEGHCTFGIEYKERYPSQVHLMYGGTKNYYSKDDQVISNFFWIHEHLFNKRRKLDLYEPKLQTTIKKYNFLMPMRTKKLHRTMILEALDEHLPQALYSYCDNGIFLPDPANETNKLGFDRNFNPDWYDDSYFSVVTETSASVTKDELPASSRFKKYKGMESCHLEDGSIMITEKTFKPIAFEHPFIIFGHAHTLQRLRNLGFETFPHIFNERYDEQESITKRLADIKECIEEFNTGHYMNPLTKEILEHNRAHFYDTALLEKMINEEIVEPLREFVNG